jgi:hypothetical protein
MSLAYMSLAYMSLAYMSLDSAGTSFVPAPVASEATLTFPLHSPHIRRGKGSRVE